MADPIRMLPLALVLLVPAPLMAQTAADCGAEPAVYAISTQGQPVVPAAEPPAAYIDDYVTIGICNLAAFLDSASEQSKTVTLFVNGMDTGIMPVERDFDNGTLTFTLNRTVKNAAVWAPVLYAPFVERTATLVVGAGIQGERPLPKLPHARVEITYHKVWFDWVIGLFLAFEVVVVLAVGWLGAKSDMLREGPASGSIRQPFSLGRVQMAAWFVLIVGGYILIWIVDGDRDTLTPSVLALAGISAATGLTAAVITPRSVVRTAALRQRLTEELAAVDRTIADLTADLATLGDRPQAAVARKLVDAHQGTRDQLAVELATVPAVFASKGFWADLVTDDRGSVALDRMQIVVWTLLLMGFFGYSIVYYLDMPDFSPTLLGLMGVSSGTYLGFKMPTVSQ